MLIKNISFLNDRKEVMNSYKFTSIPIKEQMIIAKSIEFFSDPEPCFIHRSAVIKRLIAEMEDYLLNIYQKGKCEVSCSDFDEKFIDMIDFGEGIVSLHFEL